jgi:hypothetical protein
MIYLNKIIENEKVKGAIALAAAIIMYFTPDYIDTIIETGLTAFGISKLVIGKKND